MRSIVWIYLPRHLQKLLILAAVAASILKAQDSDRTPLRPDDATSLAARVREAKRLGKTSISVPAPQAETAQPEPLDEALAHTTLVLAQFLGRAANHDDDFVTTWRKYRMLEKFSSQPILWQESDEPFRKYVPASLLPLAPDEFVMAECGGTAVVDRVTITMRNSENRVLPESRPLLMFLVFASSGAVAALNYGSMGAFWLDPSDTIHALEESPGNRLWSDLLVRSGGKLAGVRALADSLSRPR